MEEKELILKNFENINRRIETAALRSGRSIKDIQLEAVTKTKPASIIQYLIDCGQKLFGENYPEETEGKKSAFQKDGIELHLIGHLQKRKAKLVVGLFNEFESLDRIEIAYEVNKLCLNAKIIMPVLLEMNVSDEMSKSGWKLMDGSISDSFLSDFESIGKLSNLKIKGLMTLPPYTENAEDNRKYFIQMRKILEVLNKQYNLDMKELSMGTSIDFETAVEEGATIVRIGTALVGPRNYLQ